MLWSDILMNPRHFLHSNRFHSSFSSFLINALGRVEAATIFTQNTNRKQGQKGTQKVIIFDPQKGGQKGTQKGTQKEVKKGPKKRSKTIKIVPPHFSITFPRKPVWNRLKVEWFKKHRFWTPKHSFFQSGPKNFGW